LGARLREATGASGRVLLLPNHRSCLDAVILHHVLVLAGYGQPSAIYRDYIAKTPLAPFFAHVGAVFIKEHWQDPSYREYMNAYLRKLTDEGDRSATGLQLPAKRGILTALTQDKACTIYPITNESRKTGN
jgi:glycerol-3-phosphate O-acyltransferase